MIIIILVVAQHFDNIIKESQILAKKQDQLKQIIESEFNRVAANEIEAALPILTEKFEREVYTMAIERSEGNQAKAARLLGVSRFTLREKLKLYEKPLLSNSLCNTFKSNITSISNNYFLNC